MYFVKENAFMMMTMRKVQIIIRKLSNSSSFNQTLQLIQRLHMLQEMILTTMRFSKA